ncbi:MAG: Asp-tRNA(Asn)/Glu-tRNA(Gln) amidotransferase subunit GatA [Gammaproteobacteria bacterium]|nr:Asp-tRNA(Asn)/Glu-tRNA(Gln) amidotransferase subunit GatA [Gammaproteobacteria bacterium]
MHTLSLAALAACLAKREFSSVELTRHCLDRIDRLDGHLNSFITISRDSALAQAAAADQRIRDGRAGPLTGIPYANKDIFCTAGILTSCGSKMLANFIAPYDATVVTRLAEAGMVMVGKTNMDEFAMGSSNETSHYGTVRNPRNTEYVPGGSTGGSAAAVAARLVPAATGTDTGGSIRQPAALCGVSGLKPTYGRVSRWGMIAYASSLDQGGPIAGDAEDLALLLNAMAGHDPRDGTSVRREDEDFTRLLAGDLRGMRFGVPREFFTDGLDASVAARIEAAFADLTRLGAERVDISLPNMRHAIPAYYVIAPAECSSNLARYDGVRFGHRCAAPRDLEDLYRRSRAEGFGTEVKRRILVGTYVLSHGYYDAYYLRAQRVRRLISEDFRRAFEQVDFIAGPTTPDTAFRFGEKSSDPVAMYLCDVYTTAVNLAGLPALSLPAGRAGNGLPTGLQLIGRPFDEARLLQAAHQFQQQTTWHRDVPQLPL